MYTIFLYLDFTSSYVFMYQISYEKFWAKFDFHAFLTENFCYSSYWTYNYRKLYDELLGVRHRDLSDRILPANFGVAFPNFSRPLENLFPVDIGYLKI